MKTSLIFDNKPAQEWAEAYPIGNGRIGGMVYGGKNHEIIALNHDLLWRSYIQQFQFGTHKDIDGIKKLCREKKWYEAEMLLEKTVPCSEQELYINPYVPAFDLYINMHMDDEYISEYKRSLDLSKGIALTEFVYYGVHYTRTAFCSWKYGVMVVHLAASKPVSWTGEISISRIMDNECFVVGESGRNCLTISGEFLEGKRFGAVVRAVNKNGRVIPSKRKYNNEEELLTEKTLGHGYVFNRDNYSNDSKGPSMLFDTCHELTLLIKIATDDEADNPTEYCLEKTKDLPCYEELLQEHEKHFNAIYNRTQLKLSEESENACTTQESIQEERKKETLSPAMIELMYNSSKYIAISSGMPQKEGEVIKAPINLQGIWCRDTRPAWESDYHLDLNIEMCYWPLVNAGLIDYYEPFLSWVERLMEQGEFRAKDLYGANGVALVGCCDPWVLGGTDRVGATWLGSGAWLGQILWIYYEHDLRTETLHRIYPILLKIADFLESMLVEDNDGKLTFPFGSSPEMAFWVDDKIQWLSSASTCDLVLARELFMHISEAASILKEKEEVIAKYKNLSDKIRALPVDSNGGLMEWVEEHKELEPGHRHRSPMVAFCPGTSINSRTFPKEVSAIEKLLERRIEAGTRMSTTFSYAWDSQILARLHRGEDALKALTPIIQHTLGNMMSATNDYEGKGIGISWFNGIKVVQVDAQICLLSSIVELFYQDNDGVITVLPALPSIIKQGSMLGITGRNGFIIDIYWEDCKLTKIKILSKCGKKCKVKIPLNRELKDDYFGVTVIEKNEFEFDTIANETYVFEFEN